ncbi:MAG: tetratricopeptide repeat protein [Acidobacteriota bacterium]
MTRWQIVPAMLVWVMVAGAAHAQQADPDVAAIFGDAEFKKQFLGTYGIHPDIEPKLNPEERATLEKIYPLIASSPAQAIAELELAAKPDATAMFDFVLGNLYFQRDDAANAGKWYGLAVQKFPSYRRAHKNLGLIQIRDGKYELAIRSFTKMIELGGGDALSYGLLGHAYAAKQDYLAAEAAYRNALLLQPDNPDWRLGLARTIFKQQKFEEAAALLNVLLEKNPDKAEFWMLQANAYVGMKQPMKAAENLEVVYRLGKATPESLSLLGDLYVNEGQLDLAANAYVRAVDAGLGQSPSKALRSAEVLSARGGLQQAKVLLDAIDQKLTAQSSDEDRRKSLKLRARLALADGDGIEAVKVMEEVVAQDPLDGDALMLIGGYYAKQGDGDRALIYFERAANIEAFEGQAKARQAQVLVQKAKYSEALPLLKRSQEIKPSEEIARYIDQVERLARAKR